MLLFSKEFHEGLVQGRIRVTFRLWPTARVKPGGRYRCHPIGVLEVDAVERTRLGEVTEDDAKKAGFPDRAALVAYLGRFAKTPLGPSTELFRVGLHHAGDGDRVPGALDVPTGAEVEALAAKLAAMDARAERPWTRETMRLIEAQPRTAASKLAAKVGRQTAPFKADVVKLKKLGLTQSFEVGYELTPRGRACLARRPRPPGRSGSRRAESPGRARRGGTGGRS